MCTTFYAVNNLFLQREDLVELLLEVGEEGLLSDQVFQYATKSGPLCISILDKYFYGI